jgi:hypothetical protein
VREDKNEGGSKEMHGLSKILKKTIWNRCTEEKPLEKRNIFMEEDKCS